MSAANVGRQFRRQNNVKMTAEIVAVLSLMT